MATRGCAVALGVLLAMTGALGASAGETEDPEGAVHGWHALHRLETEALQAYQHHTVREEVLQLGVAIWRVASSPAFEGRRQTCGAAAQVLSFMVTGSYQSWLRAEMSRDWHHFSDRYLEHRRECLAELKLEEAGYPLPDWFGK